MSALEQMRVFVAVVERGSFVAASRALEVPRSTVSRRVADLEERLGVRLLQRTTRALRLTEVGQGFYERCRQVIADAHEAERAVRERSDVAVGKLRVSAPPAFGRAFLDRLVPGLLRACPEMELEVVLTERQVDLLADSSLVARRLGAAGRVLCAGPGYLAVHGTPTEVADLLQHDCILDGPERTWHLTGAGAVPVRSRLVVHDTTAVLALAVAGLGLALLPGPLCAPALHDGSLVAVRPEWTAGQDRGLFALYPSNRQLSPKVRAFVEHAAALARALTPG
jgi:DNA-binding transcriptional LysR family regulator